MSVATDCEKYLHVRLLLLKRPARALVDQSVMMLPHGKITELLAAWRD